MKKNFRKIGALLCLFVVPFIAYLALDNSAAAAVKSSGITCDETGQLIPIVTDQVSLPLSQKFGVHQISGMNDAGDYAFLGAGQSAVFYRAAGSSTIERVMQIGDEVPGFPGSKVSTVQTTASSIKMNSSGVIAFAVDFAKADGILLGAIFTYDGKNMTKVVSGDEEGVPGVVYGRGISVIGINNSGDVAFTAPMTPLGNITPTPQTTLFIKPLSGQAARIVGVGDKIPGSTATLSSISILSGGLHDGLTNSGNVLFSVNNGLGLFVGNVGGIRRVVTAGDTLPGGTIAPAITTGFINNSGDVIFVTTSNVWTNTASGTTTRRFGATDPVLGGQLSGNQQVQGFTDAGDVFFVSTVSGGSALSGLFRARPSEDIDVVAVSGQAAPGIPGTNFTSFSNSAPSQNGTVSFYANLSGPGPGIFQKQIGSPVVKIVGIGDSSSLPGGGYFYNMANAVQFLRTYENGVTKFGADIGLGGAYFGEFTSNGNSITPLVTTANDLPAGGRTSFRSIFVGASDNYIAFNARINGGGTSIVSHNITTQTTSVLATDGDEVPATFGGRLRSVQQNLVNINSQGTVVFNATFVGGGLQSVNGVFTANSVEIRKILVSGDLLGSDTVLAPSAILGGIKASINSNGTFLFRAVISASPNRQVIYKYSPTTGITKIIEAGQATPVGTFSSFSWANINADEDVVFQAQLNTPPTGIGLYLLSGSTITKIVAPGDAWPGGGTFGATGIMDMNDNGDVAFFSVKNSGLGAAAYLWSSGILTKIVEDGDPGPGGGTFSMPLIRPEILINNLGDVALRSNLTGGTADSGYFIRRGNVGLLAPVVLQGDAAPGTNGHFSTIFQSVNNLPEEFLQLDESGKFAFLSGYIEDDDIIRRGAWEIKPDGSIHEILVRGLNRPEFGGGAIVSNSNGGSWASPGKYTIWGQVSNGSFTEGIFLYAPTICTETPAGKTVTVNVPDSTTGSSPLSMTFSNVTEPGQTTLTTSAGGPTIPTGFIVGDPPVFFNIETTAVFSGQIEVCLNISNINFPSGSAPRLLHFEKGVWVDITTTGPKNGIICGLTDSLSPFTVATQVESVNASVSGRVFTSAGRGAPNVRVSITDNKGVSRTAFTSSFGYYKIEGIASGQTYTLAATDKQYQYAPQTITPSGELGGVDFHPISLMRK